MCQKEISWLWTNTTLTSIFVEGPALQPVNKNIIETSCLGLTNGTWPRKRGEHMISQFMDGTFSLYCGNIRYKIRKELFGPDLTEKVLQVHKRQHFWRPWTHKQLGKSSNRANSMPFTRDPARRRSNTTKTILHSLVIHALNWKNLTAWNKLSTTNTQKVTN